MTGLSFLIPQKGRNTTCGQKPILAIIERLCTGTGRQQPKVAKLASKLPRCQLDQAPMGYTGQTNQIHEGQSHLTSHSTQMSRCHSSQHGHRGLVDSYHKRPELPRRHKGNLHDIGHNDLCFKVMADQCIFLLCMLALHGVTCVSAFPGRKFITRR